MQAFESFHHITTSNKKNSEKIREACFFVCSPNAAVPSICVAMEFMHIHLVHGVVILSLVTLLVIPYILYYLFGTSHRRHSGKLEELEF